MDKKIIQLYETVPRDDYVPLAYKPFAFSDGQIPLGHQQFMLTPLEEAAILQAIDLQGNETVLEIGTGSGFFTSLLSHCAKQVISVDIIEEFTSRAQKTCTAHSRKNIEFICADAHDGWFHSAPYDVIIITGAIPRLTESLKLQVNLGGKIFAIVGAHPVMSGIVYQVDHQNHWSQRMIFETDTSFLMGSHQQQRFVF